MQRMTHRLWVFGLVAAITGCSTSSPSAPVEDAASAMTCDAVSLAPSPEAGAAACFECQASKCMPEMATCSADCTCAPAFSCLEQHSTGDSLNSGYSACEAAVNALMNGNAALMGLAGCATNNCNAECFGTGGDGG
jgi:hypothetical protein